jgi:hypothetical protein
MHVHGLRSHNAVCANTADKACSCAARRVLSCLQPPRQQPATARTEWCMLLACCPSSGLHSLLRLGCRSWVSVGRTCCRSAFGLQRASQPWPSLGGLQHMRSTRDLHTKHTVVAEERSCCCITSLPNTSMPCDPRRSQPLHLLQLLLVSCPSAVLVLWYFTHDLSAPMRLTD